MKLRNKNTGEVWDIPKMRHPTCQEDDISFFAIHGGDGKLFSYHSIAELNEEWEDFGGKDVRRQTPLAELSPYDYSKRNIVTDHTEPRGGSKE